MRRDGSSDGQRPAGLEQALNDQLSRALDGEKSASEALEAAAAEAKEIIAD